VGLDHGHRAEYATSTLFLDAGGVLVNPDWRRIARAFRSHGIPADPKALAAAEPAAKRALDQARLVQATADEGRARLFFEEVLARSGLRLDRAALDRAWAALVAAHARQNLWDRVPADVPAALERLARGGVTLAVVSNANGTLREHLSRLGLLRHFAAVLDSGAEGVEKPDPELFRRALRRTAGSPETTAHLGDLYNVDVTGARAAGIRPALLDVAGLYQDADCPRFASLSAVAEAVLAGRL
jgi:FMN phosphatase YigB (HAD superfamily)